MSQKATYQQKFDNAVLYFAKNGGFDVGKKKLAKLLYFADFTAYELKNKSITGKKYAKRDYGPMPIPKEFYADLDRLQKQNFIKIKKEDYLEKVIPLKNPDLSVFEDTEKKLLENITNKHKSDSAGDLEKLAQAEAPYKMVKYGEMIPYHLAFYRNTFGEMNLENEL